MKKINLFNGLAYLYVVLPIMIFFAGWTKWYIAVPVVVLLAFCWYRLSADTKMFDLPKLNKKQIELLAFVGLIILFWVYLSGVGRFVYQNTDHNCRNPIFEILVNYPWPATRSMVLETGVGVKGLVYYIGFWMPAAVVGKIFGMTAGYCFQALWAAFGIFLTYLLISSILKEIKIWPVLLMIFFSGMDILGYFFVNGSFANLNPADHLGWWCDFQFSDMTTQLFWVFNQAIPAWVIFLLIYKQKKNQYVAVLFACALLCSTLPAIGMIPFVIFWIFGRKYSNTEKVSKVKCWIKDTLSWENILCGGLVGVISFLYLKGNVSGQNIAAAATDYDKRGYLFMYILFIIMEIGCYYVAIYHYEKKNPLFYLSFAWLCACPWIKIGFGPDFCMRASIPALLILLIMVMQTLRKSVHDKQWVILGCLLVMLVIGSVTPWHEIIRTTSGTMTAYRNQQQVYIENKTDDEIFSIRNFSGEIEDSFFFKYLAK